MANQSIASFSEVLVTLGLSDLSTISAGDEALAQMLHGHAEGAVKQTLGYSPILATRTEYYPTRDEIAGGMLHDNDDFSATATPLNHATRAEIQGRAINQTEGDKLCMRHIPVRSVVSIYEDTEGRAGQGNDKFPASSLLTLDDDYYIDLDEDGLCRSGFIYRRGVWMSEPRSIKVTYVAGYSPEEFYGFGDIDASPIKQAVLVTAMAFFKAIKPQQANASGAFTAGPVVSETLGDYRYQLSDKAGSVLSSFGFEPGAVPDVAKELLDSFIHCHRTMIS